MKKDRSDWYVKVFSSFEEAEEADDEYYRSLSISQRLDILIDILKTGEGYSETIERSCRIHPVTK